MLYDNPPPASGQLPGFAFPPVIPSLLDSLGRSGGSSNAPGDVLADGAGFDANGNLFEPYFTNIFAYGFGLVGVGGGGNFAIDYGVCVLGDMWQAASCTVKPQQN